MKVHLSVSIDSVLRKEMIRHRAKFDESYSSLIEKFLKNLITEVKTKKTKKVVKNG